MKSKILIGLMLVSMLLLTGCSNISFQEKKEYCKTSCLEDGWEFGEFIGYGHCNCYNHSAVWTDKNGTEVRLR